MDDLINRLDNLGNDAGVLCNARDMVKFQIDPEVLLILENRLEEYEKVSISFLFFDDIDSCFRICQDCINCPYYNFLSHNNIFEFSNWNVKLMECFYCIQNFRMLKKFGITKFDAERYYKTPKYVSKKRLLFYKICENLSTKDTIKSMESIPLLSSERYLEMYILKVISSENHLESFRTFLNSLNNPTINSFLKELYGNITDVPNNNSPSLPKPIRISKEDVYPIKNPENVGLCFIVNEVNIKNQKMREGSEKDATLLKSTFESLFFDTKTFTDVPKKFFEEDFSHHVDKYFKGDHSVFVMVILSHGQQGAVICCDNKAVTIDFIIQKLAVKHQLYKIPKVLIVQACQGEKLLLVKEIATDGPSTLEYDDINEKVGTHISDFLLAMSTVPGFKAFRDRMKGSWFIQSLCHCLQENSSDCMASIITRTIKRVKEQPAPTDRDLKLGQQPEMRSLLDKKLYFKALKYD